MVAGSDLGRAQVKCRKASGSQSQTVLDSKPGSALTPCVTVGNFVNFSEPVSSFI